MLLLTRKGNKMTTNYSTTLTDARDNNHPIKVGSRDPLWCSLDTAVRDITQSGAKYMNERLAREVCSAIYGEPVSCETVYPNGAKVCVLEYGCNYEEYRTWREAVLTFIASHETKGKP